jgi:hypothetical protein
MASAVFIILLIIAFGTESSSLHGNEATWSYVGQMWLSYDVPPYIGTIENKNPGVFLVYGLSARIFGVNYWFVRFLGIACLVVTGLVAAKIAARMADRFAGILTLLIFGITVTWRLTGGVLVAQTESFMLCCSVLAFYFLTRHSEPTRKPLFLFLSGLMMGGAIAFKQVAVFTAVGWTIFFLTSTRGQPVLLRIKCIGIFFAGILLTTLISVLPLIASGVSLGDYWNGAWMILTHGGSLDAYPMRYRVDAFIRVFKSSELIALYPLIIYFFVKTYQSKNTALLGVGGWLFSDFLGANASGSYASYQLKILLPSLAIVSGIALNWLLRHFSENEQELRLNVGRTFLVTCIVGLPIYYEPVLGLRNILTGRHDQSVEQLCADSTAVPNNYHKRKFGEWLKAHTNENDLIYVAGYSSIVMAYSERRSSTRYFDSMFTGIVPDAADEIKRDLALRPPRYIAMPRFREFEIWYKPTINDFLIGFVQKGFRLLGCHYGYDVYEKMEPK